MIRSTLYETIDLAKTFIEDAEILLAEMGTSHSVTTGTKASGQLRRRSMELTRKLAELRKGNRIG